MTLSRPVQKWDVLWVKQKEARQEMYPPQPGDPTKPYRLYVVISPDAHLVQGGKITCLPVGGQSHNPFLDVPLRAGEGGVTKDCFIWCNEVFSVGQKFFDELVGSIPDSARLRVNHALRDYLDLH